MIEDGTPCLTGDGEEIVPGICENHEAASDFLMPDDSERTIPVENEGIEQEVEFPSCFTYGCSETGDDAKVEDCEMPLQFGQNLKETEFLDHQYANPKTFGVHSSQTEIVGLRLMEMEKEIEYLKTVNIKLEKQQRLNYLTLNSLEGDDELVKKLTGLSSFKMLQVVYSHIKPFLPTSTKLAPFQQLLSTLIRMRLNIDFYFLGFIFGVDCSTMSRVFSATIDVLNTELVPHVVFWPDREQLYKTMPMCFRLSIYRKCAVIIDCFEIFTERPSDLLARAQTYSQYKSHNTAKYLIGIAPQGAVIYISKGWGGRTSDKYITENCGFLRNLTPGDQVLADRGFPVAETVGLHGCSLHIPDFTKGQTQLSAQAVERTRSLASVRIHVERVIGAVRQKYTILQSTVPITLLKCDKECGLTTLDKIVRVACALTNVCQGIVSKD